MLGLIKSWWAQVFLLLAFIAALDRFTGFREDLGAIGSLATGTIGELKV